MNYPKNKYNFNKVQNLFLCRKQIQQLKQKIFTLIQTPCTSADQKVNMSAYLSNKNKRKTDNKSKSKSKLSKNLTSSKSDLKSKQKSRNKSEQCLCKKLLQNYQKAKSSLETKYDKVNSNTKNNKNQKQSIAKNYSNQEIIKFNKILNRISSNFRQNGSLTQRKRQETTDNQNFIKQVKNSSRLKLKKCKGQEYDQEEYKKSRSKRFNSNEIIDPINNSKFIFKSPLRRQKKKISCLDQNETNDQNLTQLTYLKNIKLASNHTQSNTCQTQINSQSNQYSLLQPYIQKIHPNDQGQNIKIQTQSSVYQNNAISSFQNLYLNAQQQASLSRSKQFGKGKQFVLKEKHKENEGRNKQIDILKRICLKTQRFVEKQIKPFEKILRRSECEGIKKDQYLVQQKAQNLRLWINED